MAGDMRVQLQALLDDKEKQLNLAGTLGQRILAQQLELEERINQLVDVEERLQVNPEDADSEMRNKLQELADVMQTWETENERMFSSFGTKLNGGGSGVPPSPEMPSMSELGMRSDEGSTSMRSNGPSAAQSSRRAKNAAHRANDVEFAFEIGSSLLVEVRRLQALLAERDKLIQDMKEEKDDLERAVESLRMSLRDQEGTTDKFKEENWNLEVQLQEVRTNLNDAQASTIRLEGEQKRMAKQLSSAREASDGYKTEMERLSNLLEELRNKHETDIAQMRKNAAGLQRDKSDLQASLDALKADMAKRERATARFGSPMTPGMIPHTPAQDDDIFSTGGGSRRHLDVSAIYSQGRPDGEALRDFDESPDASPSKPAVGPSHPSNELESTKQSLAHAQRQIATLKSAVQREKELNRDMKKRLADHIRTNADGEQWDDEDPEESTDVIFDEPGQRSLPRLTPARIRGRGRGRGAAPRAVGGSRVSSLAHKFGLVSSNRRHSFTPSEGEESVTSVGEESEMVPQEDLTSPFMDSRPTSMDGMDPEFADVLRNVRTRKTSIDSMGVRKPDESFPAARSTRGTSRRGRGGVPGRRVVSRPTSIVGALAGELAGEGFSMSTDDHPVSSTSASLQHDLGLVSPATSPTRSVHQLSEQDIEEVEVREFSTQTEPVVPEVREIQVIKEVQVPVEVVREVQVVKEVPVEVIKEVIKEVQVPVEVIKEVQVEVVKEIPVEVIREVIKEVPVEVIREVIKEVVKEVPVEVIREVQVVKEVEVVRETPVDVVKEVQVERVKEVPVEVIREVEVVREVPKEVIKEVPVEVIREVEVIKEVQVIKEVPTIVYQDREVPTIVYQDREVPTIVYKEREPEPKPETAEFAIQTEPEPVVLPRSTSSLAIQTQPSTSEAGVAAAAGLSHVSTQTQVKSTANMEIQADDDDAQTPVALVSSPITNGITLTPPRNRAAIESDITPTPNAIRAGAQIGLAPVRTRDSYLQTRDSLFVSGEEDARTITGTETETPTDGEWEDARESIATPSGQSEFHSMASTLNAGFQSEDDEESIRANRVGAYNHRWSLQPQPQQKEFDTKSVDAVPPPASKPELREMSVQTDALAPPTPSGTGAGFARLGTPSQFKYIPSSAASTPQSEVAMGKRPATAPREVSDIFGRVRGDRRQSIDSDASSMRSGQMSSPKPRPSISSVGPIVQVDRTRPPTMMLPPPPPMPPPPMPAVRRTPSTIAPPRPTSPPPPELIHRATTPTLGATSSLLVPQRTLSGVRQQGSNMSPAPGGLRQPASTSSFRSTPAGTQTNNRAAGGASMASSSSRRMSVSSDRSSEQHARLAAPSAGPSQQQMAGATDPTIIHAITQTMIGEFLFKYTRKVVGKGHGEKRHKRFFWIHPYTKTLYWSDADPGSSGVSESSAKSAYIDSVKSVLDPNPVPPGIHQYSIVVSTPQREMKFTAPTKERHDIWFSALNYLLARPSTVALSPESANRSRFGTATPGGPSGPAEEIRAQILSSPRSARTTGSNTQYETWNSNTTPKAFRSQSQMSSAGSVGKRAGTPAAEYMRWNPPEAASPTKSIRAYQQHPQDDSFDFENVDHDDYDDGFIPTEGDPAFEGLENVRACCDGAHDLGTLSRNPGHRHHHHNHQPRNLDVDRPISPRPASPAFSFRSRASSRSHGDGGSMFSWGGENGEKKFSLRFGSKRSKSKRPTSPPPGGS